MSPTTARRLIHAAHGITTLALLVTGLLIQWPDLRAQIVGGYGRELARLHLWFGWVFAAAPLLALTAARALAADLRQRLGPPDPMTWRNLHIVITLAGSALLTASGITLWGFDELPRVVEDVSLEIHIWATWVLAASFPVHLVVARRKIWERVRLFFGGEPPPLFDFVDEDSDAEDS